MTIQIRPIFSDLGVRSARELLRLTESPERSRGTFNSASPATGDAFQLALPAPSGR